MVKGITYEEMEAMCEAERGPVTRFCNVCSACSGPSVSNLACDYTPENTYPGIIHYRGGTYGSCHFLVREED